MARGKKFHFTYGTQNNEQHTVEIWVEGFAGTSEELQPAAMPVVVDYNKTVAESYMGGIVPAQITINVQSSSTFKASVFTSQNYGDVIIKHKTGSTVDFNCVLVPFVTRDIDLPDGAYGVELSCEFGLNYLKNVDYPTSTNRVKLATVLHTCISYVPVEDTFSYKILDGVLVASDSYGTDATRYFESYVSEENYADKTCYEVLDDICQGIREIFFSDGYWWVRNLAEINKGDSTIYNYSSAGAYVDSTAYARPTTEAGAGVRLKGAFGKEFSHKNVKITKPQSIPIVQFSEGEFDDLTDWTFEGLAALLFDTEDGKLTNLGNTIWNQTAETDPNYIVNTNPFTYQPFKNNYDLSDNEVLTLKLLAENGGQIKNLRLQIIAQQDDVYGHIYFLDSDGAWYRQDASTTQTPMYLVKNTNTEVKIEIPRPPYNSATFFTSYLLPIGVYEGLNYLIPPVGNVDYNIYIRIYLPERINDNSSGGADRFSLIDYVRFSIEKTGSEVFDGFSKDYGVTSPTDRTGKLDISFSTGFNAYPHGAETLFDASTGEKYLPYFKGVADILYNLVDDFVSRQYLDILSIRHKSWIGELYEKVDFDDLIEIDSVKYRVHNLKLDRWNKISKVTLVELASSTSSPDSYVIELPEDIKLQIEKIVKSNAEKLIFNNENFEISYGAGGLKELRLRPNSVFDQFSSKLGLANLLKEGNESTTALNWTDIDGTVTDYIRPKADGFFYLKTEGNSEEQIATADTAWMLGATNALSAASSIGSASGNYDINLKRAGTTIATLKSTGLAVPSLTSGYLPKAGTGGLLGDSQIIDNTTYVALSSAGASMTFARDTGVNIGGVGWDSGVFYLGGHPDYLPFAGNDVKLYGFNGNLSLGNAAAGDVLNVTQSGNVLIGTTSGTKKLTVNGDIQGTELTLTTGTALGYVAVFDANGKIVPTAPSALNSWAGNWNASTNTPTLADGSGTYGQWYHVEVAGTQNLGSGSITFAQGDKVIYNGSTWEKQTQNYTLNPATASVLGGIKIGSTLEIDAGTGVANQKSGVATAGTYKSVTVDTYGRVTAGTNPTTIEGYGITDAYTDDEVDAFISDLEADIAANETSIGSINTKLGTVSTNYLPKWDGSKFVNSPLYVDSYGKLTYGVSTYASGRFNVAANGELASIAINGNAQYNSYNNGYNLAIGTLNDGNSWIQASYPYAGVGKNLYLQPLRGYVGIRKQSPAYALDVAQDINYDGNLFISGAAGTDGKVLGNVSGDDTWVTLNHSYISDWNTYVTNPINTLSNTITSIMSTYLFRVDNNYVPIWNPNGNWSNSYAYQANGDFFINADTCIFGVLRGSYYETPSADQFYKVKSDASGIEAVTLDSTFITEVLSLTEGSFSRNIEGLYLTKEDAAETVFIGTDLNTGAAVIRNKYYDDNDDVKAWELSLDIYNDGRLILYDPDTEASTRYVMFLDEFEDLFNEYKSQLPTGEGGGIVPSLQTVLDNTTGTTTKRISFDNSPYVTLTELNTAIAQIPTGGSVGTLDQVLSNGNIATDRNLYFKETSASGDGSDSGLQFVNENDVVQGFINYSNDENYFNLSSAGTSIKFYSSGNLSLRNSLAVGLSISGQNVAVYADKLLVNYDLELQHAGPDRGIILKSPNGTRYRVTVDNSGNLVSTIL